MGGEQEKAEDQCKEVYVAGVKGMEVPWRQGFPHLKDRVET